MRIYFIFISLLFNTYLLNAQDTLNSIFKYSEFIEIVKSHHPIAIQANSKGAEGEYYVRKAKGGFDPKLEGSMQQKYYDNKQYYSYINGGLKIPTWFGIEAFVGYNENDGVRLNNEAYTPVNGLWNAGVSVNLGRGLFIDERRAELKQAAYLKSSSELEKTIILNQLIYDATNAYLEWNKSYEKLMLYEKSVLNIEERFRNTMQSVILGDKPALDTLKVSIQLQDRTIKLEQAKVDLLNKTNQLNIFLWQDGLIPLELSENLTPLVDISVNYNDFNIDQHPEILMADNNISIIDIDFRLKKEALKPTVQVKYNALGNDDGNGFAQNYNVLNYQWGASISYPIFTRKERANVKLTELKLNQNKAKLEFKKANVLYKFESTKNQLNSFSNQLTLQQNAVTLCEKLLIAEQTLFNQGESYMFLVNTRDNQLIESQLKLIDMQYEIGMTKALLNYSTMNSIN